MDKTILKITSAIIAEFYLLVILSISTPLLAQDNGMSQVLKTLVPPTPEAAGMIRYGEYPVSPATGVPAIDIPLYTIVCDGYELPVSISYHASGIKVNDVASEVGLGWTLNAAGIVLRNICGAPDRIDGTSGWVTSKSALDAMITSVFKLGTIYKVTKSNYGEERKDTGKNK